MKYVVNGVELAYNPEGQKIRGNNEILLKKADDLTIDTPWHSTGFTIARLYDEEPDYEKFLKEVRSILLACWRRVGIQFENNTPLSRYHEYCLTQEQHIAAVDQTKLLSVNDFPLSINWIIRRAEEQLGIRLKAFNPYDQQSVYHFRVVRPLSGDNNPLHRDVWLEDYSSCINLYIPIAGSNEKSSLIILPGSHLWSESQIVRTATGAIVNGVKFNVPGVSSIDGEFKVIRPNPGHNEFLLFSPYLIHGGSVNLNKDETRISIELRLWRR